MFRARGTRVLFKPAASAAREEHPVVEPAPDAALETFGLPALPVDFLDQVRAAQRGDKEALALMREIGAMVPEHLRVSFAAYVQDLLAESARG